MTESKDLTTEEVAELLQVSKLTVYDVIKKGELQSYRVGRQIRVKPEALELYKNKGFSQHAAIPSQHANKNGSSVIITGQDNCLDILAKQLEGKNEQLQPLRSQLGSLDGLIAMYHHEADIVSTHLYDGDTQTYNLPYIRKILVSKSFTVVHLLQRKIGFFVKKGNPKKVTDWRDLEKPQLRIINREPGAGARVLLDEQLRLHNINAKNVQGYEDELSSHLDIANAIASGKADVGIGTGHVAKIAPIDFIPLMDEQYDLVLLHTKRNETLIKNVLDIITQPDFRHMLENLGYVTTNTGTVLYNQ